MSIELTEYDIAGSGAVSLRYFKTASEGGTYRNILVVQYSGEYPLGSAGNIDARYMYVMAMAAIASLEPRGIIHDLTELRYEWGDMLERVFDAIPETAFMDVPLDGEALILPVAVVVSHKCEEAVRTLLLGINSKEPLEKIGWVFRDLAVARRHVSDVLAEDEKKRQELLAQRKEQQ